MERRQAGSKPTMPAPDPGARTPLTRTRMEGWRTGPPRPSSFGTCPGTLTRRRLKSGWTDKDMKVNMTSSCGSLRRRPRASTPRAMRLSILGKPPEPGTSASRTTCRGSPPTMTNRTGSSSAPSALPWPRCRDSPRTTSGSIISQAKGAQPSAILSSPRTPQTSCRRRLGKRLLQWPRARRPPTASQRVPSQLSSSATCPTQWIARLGPGSGWTMPASRASTTFSSTSPPNAAALRLRPRGALHRAWGTPL
mmetsp:Transcript_80512/g.239954  ORF Transcript_80512/g.239954 Transcript_80512/m.239954 type:complete len:251 (+) Transcript_80512:646-1398(+)